MILFKLCEFNVMVWLAIYSELSITCTRMSFSTARALYLLKNGHGKGIKEKVFHFVTVRLSQRIDDFPKSRYTALLMLWSWLFIAVNPTSSPSVFRSNLEQNCENTSWILSLELGKPNSFYSCLHHPPIWVNSTHAHFVQRSPHFQLINPFFLWHTRIVLL